MRGFGHLPTPTTLFPKGFSPTIEGTLEKTVGPVMTPGSTFRETIKVKFTPPHPKHEGKVTEVQLEGDAKLVGFKDPGTLHSGDEFEFEIEWTAPDASLAELNRGLTANYKIRILTIAPARMFQKEVEEWIRQGKPGDFNEWLRRQAKNL